MSPDYEAKIIEVFGDLFSNGYVYKGKNQYIGVLRSALHTLGG